MIFNLVWLPARQTGSSTRTKVLLRIMLRDTTVCEDDLVKQALSLKTDSLISFQMGVLFCRSNLVGKCSSVRGSPDAVVQAKPSAEANWQAHMSAGRLRLYQAPCPSVGFGACDAAFPAILQEHGSDPFKLFHRTSSNDWYLNPANIP